MKQKPSSRTRSSKRLKSEIDEALKQGNYTIIPSISLDQTVKLVVKNGNLKPLYEWYEKFDENGKMTLEEATIEYMNVYSKSLIELMSLIPKRLYNILDIRRQKTKADEEKIREYVLVNLCSVITKAEIDRILQLTKDKF